MKILRTASLGSNITSSYKKEYAIQLSEGIKNNENVTGAM